VSPQVIALGEPLVEVMRKEVDQPLSRQGEFLGPFPSGAPAIFIDAVARLGVSAGFIGVVGGTEDKDSSSARRADAYAADAFGECVIDHLRDDGVDTTHVRIARGFTTGTAFVAYRSDGNRNFLFHLPHSAASLLSPDDIDAAYIARAQFLHVTGSALSISASARQACYKAIRICKAAGGRVSFDPNIRPELLGIDEVREICQPVLAQCDLLLPSGAEATMLTGSVDEETACRDLVGNGIAMVALKRGAKGSTVFTTNPQMGEVSVIDAPPLSVTEVDPTGAGDCYGGAFVTGLLAGWDLAHVARFANIVGALAVTRKGPMEGAPYRREVLVHM
jgi:sugar/nucleoside kinase (ribokinase family)